MMNRLITWTILATCLAASIMTFQLAWHSGRWPNWVLFPAQFCILLMCVYTFMPVLCAVGLDKKAKTKLPNRPSQKFLLLIPAHNEAAVLPQLLESMQALQYPSALFQTLVVADNCTDNTAELAYKAGIEVLERRSKAVSDKTQALHAASSYLQEKAGLDPNTFIVILDADCNLPPDFLLQLDAALSAQPNAHAIQCNRAVLNHNESKVACLDAASEALRQRLQSQVRGRLGLENSLYGLGSAFQADLFHWLTRQKQLVYADDKAWKAHLTIRNIPVLHAPNAILYYTTSAHTAGFGRQRLRWVSGHYDMIRAFFLPISTLAIRRGDASALDFAATIITLPRSFLLLFTIGFGMLAWLEPALSLVSWPIWLAVAGCFIAYAALGLAFIGARPAQYTYLFGGLGLVWSVIVSNIRRLTRKGESRWVVQRTPADMQKSPLIDQAESIKELSEH
jgi:cellulose synthase/poly-beta-1,6-N-acetylglucosamine synthase-like glycosyltransferase